MSKLGQTKIIVLFEDELRTAAVALRNMKELFNDASATDDARREAWKTAFEACHAALYHAMLEEHDDVQLTIGTKSMFRSARKGK